VARRIRGTDVCEVVWAPHQFSWTRHPTPIRDAQAWRQAWQQACLRPRDRFWDIPVPKIDSAFDNLFVPQPSWSPSTTQQLRKLVAAPYLSPNDWTPRSDAYFASPLALCARRVSSAASRLLGTTSLRFALHGW
ncbi:hypothetical protein, partial [Thiolapillus sp.]|uniref:hypothetical protein n=2 Tax=Thiolapillus sp. TaxID=2017437 RepID=UPI003AF42B0C